MCNQLVGRASHPVWLSQIKLPSLPASTLVLPTCSRALRHLQCYFPPASRELALLKHGTGQLVLEVLLLADLALCSI